MLRSQLVLRQWSIAAGCGFLAGLVTIGLGLRVAMRLSGLFTPAPLHGTLTDAGEVVGEITVGGSATLVFIGGVMGVPGAIGYMLVRRWLPEGRAVHALAVGAMGLAAGGAFLFEPDNIDFRIFGPVWLNVPMYGALPFLFGAVVVPMTEFFDERLPAPPVPGRLVAAAAVPVVMSLPTLLGVSYILGVRSLPRVFVTVVALAVLLAARLASAGWLGERAHGLARAGPWVVGALVAAGLAITFGHVAHIFAG